MGVGNPRHGIGDARPGRDQRHANLSGDLCMGVRHVDRGTLVAHINDPDPLSIELHPQRHDVAATQTEHAVDATGLEATGNPCCGAAIADLG